MYHTYDMEYIKKTITIKKEQEDWIKQNNINLSRLVQAELDRRIKKR